MKKIVQRIFFFFVLMLILSSAAYAQFEEPEIVKVTKENRATFQERFSEIKWTGQGFNFNELDRMPSIEIRANLQNVFGNPTQKVGDIIEKDGKLRPGKAVQFEYWFIIDGEIPMMILDLDGPFEDGLVYVGASRYIDMMPQVKRTLTKLVTEADPSEFEDYFFSPEREQWYKVSYKAGQYKKVEIKEPPHFNL
ncbi:MAG: hypothetical protein FH748_17280 [Balneolaceae bacterium]|nr:hypothetical protein [Balneolaceae bacterium]